MKNLSGILIRRKYRIEDFYNDPLIDDERQAFDQRLSHSLKGWFGNANIFSEVDMIYSSHELLELGLLFL